MHWYTIFLLQLILNLGILSNDADEDEHNRIVGGERTKIVRYPYQLALRAEFSTRHGERKVTICGAALIKRNVALTAAHCMKHRGRYKVRAGSTYLNKDGIVANVIKAVIHPKYETSHNENDLAIIFLDRYLPKNGRIQPIPLINPSKKNLVSPGVKGTISGWGQTYAFRPGTTADLRAVLVPIIPKRLCEKSPGKQMVKTKFCAGFIHGGGDSCMGDSGGPFVVNGVLVGLVSGGTGFECGKEGVYGTYTDLQLYRNFIWQVAGV